MRALAGLLLAVSAWAQYPVPGGGSSGGTGGGSIPVTSNALRGNGGGGASAVTGTGTDCVLVNGSSGACGSGGGGSVFTGSTASTVASSATPAFSLADVSVKSPIRFNISPVVNVTAPTFTNLSAGARFDVAITSDGTHTWNWNGTVSDNVCQIWTATVATTVATLEVDPDGSTIHGVGCSGGPAGLLFYGAAGTTCATTPGAGFACGWIDATAKNLHLKNDAGSTFALLLSGVDINPDTGVIANLAVTTAKLAALAVTSPKLAVVNTTRSFGFKIGLDNTTALATADIQPQKGLFAWDVPVTVQTIIVTGDAGASTVQLGYRHSSGGAPTTTNYTSAVLTLATVSNITDKIACANAGGTAITYQGVSVTCSTLATQVGTQFDDVETTGGTADGTTRRLTVQFVVTVN